jgi:hypothetical protein
MSEQTKTIYNLELHEELELNQLLKVIRVPGGWIYKNFEMVLIPGKLSVRKTLIDSCFVPLTNEGKPKKNSSSVNVEPSVH